MLAIIPDMPDDVLAVSATGKITGEDYKKVLVPALEERLKRHRKICFLYHLGEAFTGFTGAAMWDDAIVGMHHLAGFDKIAVVTDVDWIVKAVKLFSFVIPANVRTFSNGGLEEAKAWVSESMKRPQSG
jgi:hypothetical protein